MSKLTIITDRALDLVNQAASHAGDFASQAGSSIRGAIPTRAEALLQTGVALGAAKTGARVATTFVRRNPLIAIGSVAAAGLLFYAAHRKRQRDLANGPIPGRSKRIEAKRTPVNPPRKRATRTTADDAAE